MRMPMKRSKKNKMEKMRAHLEKFMKKFIY